MESSTMKPTSWRSLIKVHPAAEMFPEMEGDEFKSLVEDIREHGLKTVIHTWFDKREQEWLLDGRNRLNAMAELGYRFKIVKTGGYGSARPHLRITKPDSKETEGVAQHFARGQQVTDPYAYVISANIHRRHLTVEQKRDLIAALIKAKPERSDRATAAIAKTSPQTVTKVRKDLEATAQIEQLDAHVGKDGKTRKSKKAALQPLADKALAMAATGFAFPVKVAGQYIAEEDEAVAEALIADPAAADPAQDETDLAAIKSLVRNWWVNTDAANRIAFGQWFDDLRLPQADAAE
jgi:hypothetical protein